jgi:hypothetical protein
MQLRRARLDRDRRIDVTFLLLGGLGLAAAQPPRPAWATRAAKLPADLPVKPPPTMAGYSRERFGPPWKDVDRNGCDTRDDILRLDLRHVRFKVDSDCVIASGTLKDPYTGTKIEFVRGVGTSSACRSTMLWRSPTPGEPAHERGAPHVGCGTPMTHQCCSQ